MMKSVRDTDLTLAVSIDGRSHGRTPAVRLVLDERDKLLVEAARFIRVTVPARSHAGSTSRCRPIAAGDGVVIAAKRQCRSNIGAN